MPEKRYVKMKYLIERFGVCDITIHRWQKLDEHPFPKAHIQQRGVGDLYLLSDIEAWEAGE